MSEALERTEVDLAQLTEAVEALLEEARAKAASEGFGGVNWGDLGIADIEQRMSLRYPERPRIVVMIEEASPDSRLAPWLGERLDPEAFPRVYFECEW